MNRRRVLASAGVAFAGLLGGCSGDDGAGANGSEATAGSTGTDGPGGTDGSGGTSDRTTTGGTTDGSETSTPESTETSRSIPTDDELSTQTTTAPATTPSATTGGPATATTDGSGTAVPLPDLQSTQSGDGATVAFEEGGSRVVVTGTIVAQDGCRRAVLDSAQSDGGTLVVSVGTERDAGTDMLCTQALTPVEYRFVVTPDDPTDSVRVVHGGAGDRRTVVTADRTD
ncbi:hypothetical protein [Halococcus hamelinensis]|uniref:Lipoprotein n=1 Tax=Halococcus hamelinensis 100A6 TaxID=1132509 RepID=M0M7S9_9EURY|nr:hypothetical protein [Halococcus hamelinensis]EMA41423.1 hypothetical protein C447_01175 [Halococcus hamelinensis 100A6]